MHPMSTAQLAELKPGATIEQGITVQLAPGVFIIRQRDGVFVAVNKDNCAVAEHIPWASFQTSLTKLGLQVPTWKAYRDSVEDYTTMEGGTVR